MTRFVRRIGRVSLLGLAILALLIPAPPSATALSCVPLTTEAQAEAAAVAALKGDRSFGATSFVIGEVVGLDRSGESPRLDIRATHIFVAGHPSRFEAFARPDGPPALGDLRPGALYFLALRLTEVNHDSAVLLAPCAPIFAITSRAQLDRLVNAADYSEAVGAIPALGDPVGPTSVDWPALALLGLGSIAIVLLARSRLTLQRRRSR